MPYDLDIFYQGRTQYVRSLGYMRKPVMHFEEIWSINLPQEEGLQAFKLICDNLNKKR